MKKQRTPRDKYEDLKARGRSLEQMRAIAVARGDSEFIAYLGELREALKLF